MEKLFYSWGNGMHVGFQLPPDLEQQYKSDVLREWGGLLTSLTWGSSRLTLNWLVNFTDLEDQ